MHKCTASLCASAAAAAWSRAFAVWLHCDVWEMFGCASSPQSIEKDLSCDYMSFSRSNGSVSTSVGLVFFCSFALLTPIIKFFFDLRIQVVLLNQKVIL